MVLFKEIQCQIRYKRLIVRLIKLRTQFERPRESVFSMKSLINTKDDIRITFFSNCIIAIDSSVLILMFSD